jgi:hypothetical protein
VLLRGICEGDDPEGKKKGHLDKMKSMRDGISNCILQQHKDKVTDQIECGKHFLSEDEGINLCIMARRYAFASHT